MISVRTFLILLVCQCTLAQDEKCKSPCEGTESDYQCLDSDKNDNLGAGAIFHEWKGDFETYRLNENEKDNKYVVIEKTETGIALKTTEEFENFDLNEFGRTDKFRVVITTTCKDDPTEKEITYYATIVDVNSNDPKFTMAQYEINLPMPFPRGITISENTGIIASDIDFSNSDIIFSIDSDDFEIRSEKSATDEKSFICFIKTKNQINFEQEEFTITATDSGKPDTRSSTAKLIISKNNEDSIPEFEKNLYTATYTTNGETGALENLETIKILNFKDVEISVTEPDLFTVSQNDGIVLLKIKNDKLPDAEIKDKDYIVCTIMAKTSESFSIQTSVLIDLPKPTESEDPEFEKNLYTATYTTNGETGALENLETIKILNFKDVEISVTEPDLFTVSQNDGIVLLKIKNDKLPDVEIKDKDYIVCTIMAKTSESFSIQTSVLIDLPKPTESEDPEFEKAVYKATYTTVDENNGNLVVEETIKITNFGADTTVKVDDKDNFKVEPNVEDGVVTLSLANKNLPDSILLQEYLTLTITATTGDLNTNTIVIIDLPDSTDKPIDPEFEKAVYKATYTTVDENNGNLVVEETIKITNFDTDTQVVVNDEDNFKVEHQEGVVTLSLKNAKLPANILSQKYILLTIVATTITNEDSLITETNVLINLPGRPDEQTEPKFEKLMYKGTYTIEGDDGNLVVKDIIKITNVGADTSVQVDDKDNFKVDLKDEDGVVTLGLVNKNLPDSILLQEYLTLTITATTGELNTNTIVIIDLPDSTDKPIDPEFEKAVYKATYTTVDENNGNLVVEETIKITNFDTDTHVEVDDEDNFKVERQEGVVTLSLKNAKLPANILSLKYLHLTIVATTITNEDILTTETNVLINLPDRPDEQLEPKFEKLMYKGTYTIEGDDGNLVVKDIIKITNVGADTTIKVDDEVNFKVDLKDEDGVVTLGLVNKNLPDSILLQEYLTLTITATTGDLNTNTIVIIDLPDSTDKPIDPEFEKAVYKAIYTTVDENNGNLVVEETIKITNFGADTTVKVDDKDNFKVELKVEDGVVTLGLANKNLPDSILSQEYLTLTITATTGELNTNTIVIIDLPDSTDKPIDPEFEKAVYKATYTTVDENNGNLVVEETIKITNFDTDTQVVVNDKDNFKVEHQEGVVTLSLKNAKLPANILSQKYILLTIVATTITNEDILTTETNVLINLPDMPDEQIEPKFEKLMYKGTYTIEGDDGNLVVKDIIKITNVGADTTIKVDDEDNFKVELKVEDGVVTLGLANKKLPDSILSQEYLTLTITATTSELNTNTIIIIDLPDSTDEPIEPEFEKPLYTATYQVNDDGGSLVNMEKIIINDVSSDTTVKTDLSTNFDVSQVEGKVTLTLKDKLPESLIKDQNYVICTITASTPTNLETKTAVLINIPKPAFKKPFYKTTYTVDDSDNGSLGNIEDIFVTNVQDVIPSLNYISVKVENDKVIFELVANIPETIIKEEEFVTCTLTATSSIGEKVTAVVLIQLPGKTACPSPPEVIALQYYEDTYSFYLPNELENPLEFSISALVSPHEEIQYSISEGGTSDVEYDPKTGLLTVKTLPKSSPIELTVTASAEKTAQRSTAKVTLVTLEPSETCDETQAEFALIVNTDLEEGKTYDNIDILKAPLNDYQYTVTSEDPKGFFSVDPLTGKISCKELDRETNDRHTLIVKLDKNSKKSSFRDIVFNKMDSKCSLGNIENVDRTTTVIIFEVQDINDNAPVFDENKYNFGYPNKDLLDLVPVVSIGQVAATDLDIGENGEIQYTINDNKYISINAITGVIYATSEMKEDTTFVVTATDQNGKGKSTEVSVKILRVTKDELVIAEVTNVNLEDLDDALADLSTEYNVKSLTVWTIPKKAKSYRKRATTTDYAIKVTLFAIDGKENLVSSAKLEKEIDSASGFSAETFNDHLNELLDCDICKECPTKPCKKCEPCECSCEDGGYIAGIIVLGALLVFGVIAALFYFFGRRRRNQIISEESQISQTTPPEFRKNIDLQQVSVEPPSSRRATGFVFNPPPPEDEEEDEEDEKEKQGDMQLVDLNGIEPKVQIVEPEYTNNHVYDKVTTDDSFPKTDFVPARERKKSVTFNERLSFKKEEEEEDTRM